LDVNAKQPHASYYRCVECDGGLLPAAGEMLACGVCRAEYPSLRGVDVLALDHRDLLESYVRGLGDRRREVAGNQARLADSAHEAYSSEALAVARAGFDRQLANLGMVERALAPVEEYLAAHPRRPSLLGDFHLAERGWPSLTMLGYFYRDWGAAAERQELTEIFSRAAARHGDGGDSAAVLGCGACRLVHDLAALFPTVFGVDLAVDSLLLAGALLDGAEMEVSFSFPRPEIPVSQHTVTLRGPAERRPGIRLVAGDAGRLPFAAASLSWVMTPYLLDIVANPKAVMSEVGRVLAPGGVWLNFSNLTERSSPPAVRAFHQLDNLDLPSFLHRNGFTLLEQGMHRFAPVDLSGLSAWAVTQVESPLFFAARREALPVPAPRDLFAEHFAGGGADAEIWRRSPRIAAHVALLDERVFTGAAVEEHKRISVSSAAASRLISPQSAMVAEWLLRHLDGAQSLAAIFDQLRRQYGDAVGADDFLRLFRELHTAELIALEGG
jgi:SAM-dependent methyltransferase